MWMDFAHFVVEFSRALHSMPDYAAPAVFLCGWVQFIPMAVSLASSLLSKKKGPKDYTKEKAQWHQNAGLEIGGHWNKALGELNPYLGMDAKTQWIQNQWMPDRSSQYFAAMDELNAGDISAGAQKQLQALAHAGTLPSMAGRSLSGYYDSVNARKRAEREQFMVNQAMQNAQIGQNMFNTDFGYLAGNVNRWQDARRGWLANNPYAQSAATGTTEGKNEWLPSVLGAAGAALGQSPWAQKGYLGNNPGRG